MIDKTKIPEERVAVLIGKNGQTKKRLYAQFKVQIDIKDSEVTMEGEPFDVFIVKQIVKAIGRGFSPEHALLLEKDEYQLEIIEIAKYANTKNAVVRLRGRVIGKAGASKEKIEELTESYISVYGKTVAIIAKVEMMPIAVESIDMLLRGSRHGTVYKFIENRIKHINV